jgi:hypothetical protein
MIMHDNEEVGPGSDNEEDQMRPLKDPSNDGVEYPVDSECSNQGG